MWSRWIWIIAAAAKLRSTEARKHCEGEAGVADSAVQILADSEGAREGTGAAAGLLADDQHSSGGARPCTHADRGSEHQRGREDLRRGTTCKPARRPWNGALGELELPENFGRGLHT